MLLILHRGVGSRRSDETPPLLSSDNRCGDGTTISDALNNHIGLWICEPDLAIPKPTDRIE